MQFLVANNHRPALIVLISSSIVYINVVCEGESNDHSHNRRTVVECMIKICHDYVIVESCTLVVLLEMTGMCTCACTTRHLHV